MNNTLIFGNGYIANRLQKELKYDITPDRILTFHNVESEIKKYKPNIIINCIGHIGNNVDDCEKDPDKTLHSNSYVPLILSEVALHNNIMLVHISSGCIYNYDKDEPIDETKEPDYFKLFYSRTKIYADRALEILANKYPILIIRLRIPLDNKPHPKNILTKLIGFKKIIDIPNSVTYIPDFVKAVKHLVEIKARGIYNVVNSGALRYPDLLDVYKKYHKEFKYTIMPYSELGLDRTNLVLSTNKLKSTGFKVRNINSILEECIKEYNNAI